MLTRSHVFRLLSFAASAGLDPVPMFDVQVGLCLQVQDLKILASREQNAEGYVPLDVSSAEKLARDIKEQVDACISGEESASFSIKVCTD